MGKHAQTTRASEQLPATVDRLYTVRETCRITTLSRISLWRHRDELPPIHLTPARIAYRDRDIQTFIDRRAGRLPARAAARG